MRPQLLPQVARAPLEGVGSLSASRGHTAGRMASDLNSTDLRISTALLIFWELWGFVGTPRCSEEVWGDAPWPLSGHCDPNKTPFGTSWSARRSEPSEARRALNSQTGATKGQLSAQLTADQKRSLSSLPRPEKGTRAVAAAERTPRAYPAAGRAAKERAAWDPHSAAGARARTQKPAHTQKPCRRPRSSSPTA